MRELSSRAGSTNSWTNDIGLKIRVDGRKVSKGCGRTTLEVSGMEDDIADLEVVRIKKIK